MSTNRTTKPSPDPARRDAPRIQAKLQVGAANDPLEVEADRAAAAFVRWQGSGILVGDPSAPASLGAAPVARVHRSADAMVADPLGSFTAPADVERRIEAARGGGSALPEGQRARFESFFGADLSGVRVHRGGSAAALNRDISARAFTTGSDVFVGAGESTTGAGEQLLAHELAHVVQQGGGAQRTVRRANGTGRAEHAGEAAGGVGEFVGSGSELQAQSAGGEGAEAGLGETAASEGLGLLSALAGWWVAMNNLMEVLTSEHAVGEEQVFAGFDAVGATGSSVKSAVTTAQTAGASIGSGMAAAIPGLDIAVTALALLVHIARLSQLARTKYQQGRLVDATRAQLSGGPDAAAQKKLSALVAIQASTSKAFYQNVSKIVGDVLMLAGSVTTLTVVGAPAGLVLKIVGASVQLGTWLSNYAAEQSRMFDLAVAKEEQAAAEAAAADPNASPEVKAAAEAAMLARLELDVGFAVDLLLEELVSAPPLTPADEENPTLANVFAPLGIGPKWLARFRGLDPAGKAAAAEEARKVVLDQLGVKEKPHAITQVVIGGLRKASAFVASTASKVGTAISDLFTDADVVAMRHDTKELAKPVLAGAVARLQLTGGEVTGDWVTRQLLGPLAGQRDKANNEANPTKSAAMWEYLDWGIKKAVLATLPMMPQFALKALEVKDGVVRFPAFTFARPGAAAQGSASAPASGGLVPAMAGP